MKKTVAVRAEAFSEKHRYIDTECCQLISGSKVAYGQPSDGSCADARDPIKPRALIAKFHYTDPTGPARTFLGRNSVGSVRVADKVRAGRVGSV